MMKCIKIILSVLTIILAVPFDNYAQDNIKDYERPIIGYYNFEIGTRQNLSTYLSPLVYKGTNLAVSGYWTKVLPSNPEHLTMAFETRFNYASLLNRPHTALELDFHGFLTWSLEWKQRLANNFILGIGGNTGLYGGLMYLTRNGNNPVAAQAAFGIGLSASAGWHTRIQRLPVLFTYRASIPLASVFFSPEYGETYYEIYLGNHSGLAHFGYPGNRGGIDNLFSCTLDFGKTAMQIGYRFSLQTAYVNNLTTRTFNNAFVIGVVPGGLGLKNRKEKSVNPLY